MYVDGSYDDAVRAAARLGDEDGYVLVQDTAWDGYEDVPGWIVDGYDTLFVEIDEQRAVGLIGPTWSWFPPASDRCSSCARPLPRSRRELAYRGRIGRTRQRACVRASLEAGRPVTVKTGSTAMAGLNCGTMSSLAWPAVVAGLDAAVTDDISARGAGDVLAEMGIDVGPCGAASAAIRDVLSGSDAVTFRRHVGIEPTGTVVLLITEGTAANPNRHK